MINFSPEFNYTMKWVDDGAYGSNDTGEWNGMLGEIIENVRHNFFRLTFALM